MGKLNSPQLDGKLVFYLLKQGSEPTEADAKGLVSAAFSEEIQRQFTDAKLSYLILKCSEERLVKVGSEMKLPAEIAALLQRDPAAAAEVVAMIHLNILLGDPVQVGQGVAAKWTEFCKEGKMFFLQRLVQDGGMRLFMLMTDTASVKKPWWKFW